MSKWHGVAEEKQIEWQQIFAASTEGLRLSAACPLCGQRGLRRYFGGARETTIAKPGFVGKGGSWEWCSSCGSFEHASCLVPAWWQPISGINESNLSALPEELEVQLKAMGHV